MSPRRGLPDRTEGHEPAALLPLTPLAFSILIALAEDDKHGYAIGQRIAERDAGSVTLAPGNLYASLDRLIRAGLVAPVGSGGSRPRGHRGREYRITRFGRRVARLEAERLSQLVRTARRIDILPGKR